MPKYVTGADIETNNPVNNGIKTAAQPNLEAPVVDEVVADIAEVEEEVEEVFADVAALIKAPAEVDYDDDAPF